MKRSVKRFIVAAALLIIAAGVTMGRLKVRHVPGNPVERGGNLSAGERQLLSFTRAMAANPRILILDEATSAVDPHTETIIQNALEKLFERRTSFVIAHRLSTVRHAHQIIVLSHGRIVERGTHQELLAAGGLYAHLHRMQFRED